MALLEKARITKDLRVGLGAFLLAKGGQNIDKALVILHILLGPAPSSFSPVWPLWDSDPASAGTTDFTCKHVASYLLGAQNLHPTLAQGSLILSGHA